MGGWYVGCGEQEEPIIKASLCLGMVNCTNLLLEQFINISETQLSCWNILSYLQLVLRGVSAMPTSE